MPRRAQLKGAAVNLAQFCTSRNFDCEGYWAMGVLYAFALDHRSESVILNLTDCSVEPGSDTKRFAPVLNLLTDILNKNIEGNKIPNSWVQQVRVVIDFDAKYQNKYHYRGSALGGKPYICRAQISTDLGRIYQYETGGNVWVHNPKREFRRSGF